jgi:four helix bundle protein
MSDSKDRNRRPIRSFLDLEVYQTSYQASLDVIRQILPALPPEEQDDLKDQMRRACKAVPRLIAEGYSKKHQKRGFQKYLDDALTESNEMIVSLNHSRDLYVSGNTRDVCEKLVSTYTSVSKMLFTLRRVWDNFGGPPGDSGAPH